MVVHLAAEKSSVNIQVARLCQHDFNDNVASGSVCYSMFNIFATEQMICQCYVPSMFVNLLVNKHISEVLLLVNCRKGEHQDVQEVYVSSDVGCVKKQNFKRRRNRSR